MLTNGRTLRERHRTKQRQRGRPAHCVNPAANICEQMEIHAPHGPVNTWREFGVHIAIVSIGILIALSLEGLREFVHDRGLVRGARSNFRRELAVDSHNIGLEAAAVRQAEKDIRDFATALPALAQDSSEVARRLDAIHNPFYFFVLNSWQTAVSTRALSLMSEDEVEQYSGAEFAIRTYTNLQGRTLTVQDAAIAFFRAHPNPTPPELREGTERVLIWAQAEDVLSYVCGQTQASINAAYERSRH